MIDPNESSVEMVELELDQDRLCDVLRCDATDMIDLPWGFLGYVDGEGSWQGRQQEWSLNENSYWGPMLVFKALHPGTGETLPCDEKDFEQLQKHVQFFDL